MDLRVSCLSGGLTWNIEVGYSPHIFWLDPTRPQRVSEHLIVKLGEARMGLCAVQQDVRIGQRLAAVLQQRRRGRRAGCGSAGGRLWDGVCGPRGVGRWARSGDGVRGRGWGSDRLDCADTGAGWQTRGWGRATGVLGWSGWGTWMQQLAGQPLGARALPQPEAAYVLRGRYRCGSRTRGNWRSSQQRSRGIGWGLRGQSHLCSRTLCHVIRDLARSVTGGGQADLLARLHNGLILVFRLRRSIGAVLGGSRRSQQGGRFGSRGHVVSSRFQLWCWGRLGGYWGASRG